MGNKQSKKTPTPITEKEPTQDKPKIIQSIQKTSFIETTIDKIELLNDTRFKIYCSPSPLASLDFFDNRNYLFLSRSNPNFIELYNKLQSGTTHNFEYIKDNNNVLNITDLNTYKIIGIINGFINISNEGLFNNRNLYETIISGHHNRTRILMNGEHIDKIEVGEKYEIGYVKAYRTNFYRVTYYKKLGSDMKENDICL